MAAPETGKPSPAPPPGLSAADWGSIRSEYERSRCAAIPTENGYTMRNFGQSSNSQCDDQGFLVQPDGAGWTWGLSLKSYGFSGRECTPEFPPRLNAEGSVVSWERDDSLREWLVNDAHGLEHGFTLSERPRMEESFFASNSHTFETPFELTESGPLTITLSVRGTLFPEVQSDGLGVRFTNGEGASVLTYSGLKVWDADGKILPARLEPVRAGDTTLRLTVDETGARYPLTIDPIVQQAYLKASNSGAGDQFGYAVAASGTTVAVSALNDDVGGASSGAVYIFVRGTTGWTQQGPALKASNPGVQDLFGWSLGLSGDTLVVGAPNEDSDALGVGGNQSNNGRTDSGAAYVFTRSGINWVQKAYLKASYPSQYFGQSAAISGNTIVIGAHYESSDAKGVNNYQNNQNATFSGAAYVFVLQSNGTWAPDAYLKASNTSVGALFGYSAAISGDTIVIGGFGEFSKAINVNGDDTDHSMENAGAAYVFFRSNGTWTQQAYLKASNTEKDDKFGCSVGISGETIVVGAMHEDGGTPGVNNGNNNNSPQSGAAYIFTRANNSWSPKAYLKASNPGEQDAFGYSVAISGDTIAVGSLQEGSSTTGINSTGNNNAPNSGAVYVFARNANNNTWSEQAYLKASNTGEGDVFGRSVAVSGNYVVTGATGEASNAMGVNGDQSDNTNPYSGAAYVFARTSTWGQDAYLKASNTTANGDQFGYSVAVSGDIVVVGAPQEASNATSVDGNQGDTSAANAGAAYVFARTNGVWKQEAYLKASNAEAQDYFGWSVAAADDYVVVGAKFEDGGTTGINNSIGQVDNTKTDAGAAYIFTRSGNTWLQTAHLKAANPNPANLDHFGIAVAASGNTVVVGADDQDLGGTAGAGGAYVFVRTGNVWAQQDFLKVAHPLGETRFGGAVAISGDTIVVGADREDSAAMGVNGDPLKISPGILNSGAAFVFTRDAAGDWTEQAYLKASNTGANDAFGWSVGVAGDTVVVGAYHEGSDVTDVHHPPGPDNNNAANSGAAYIFERTNNIWAQKAYLKASNTGASDQFGQSVAASSVAAPGDTVAVGAFVESSNATGVDGIQTNNSAGGSGAVYLFRRSGTGMWTQLAYVKASNTDAGDGFGTSVALSGGTLAVGAFQEDSNARGVNGNQTNNSSLDSGAAYVFNLQAQAALLLWRNTNFGTPDNSGDGADTADPDHDGLVNLLEFATGQPPQVRLPLPATLTNNAGQLSFTYPRLKAAKTEIQFSVEWSDSLEAGSWSSDGTGEVIQSDNGATEQVKVSLPLGSAKRFVRLRVTAY